MRFLKVNVDKLDLIGGRQEQQGGYQQPQQAPQQSYQQQAPQQAPQQQAPQFDAPDDDIPFMRIDETLSTVI